MPKNITEFYSKYKIILFPAVVMLSAFILIVFVIFPQFTNLLNNRREQETLSQKLTILEAKAQELEVLSREDLRQKLNLALIALPTDKDYTSIIGLIQQLVAIHNFNLSSLQFGNISAAKDSKSFSVDLQIVGPEDNVSKLLSDLESSSRVMKLSKLDSSVSSGGGVFTNLNLTLEIFYAPLPSNIGSLDTPIIALTENDISILNKLSSMQISSATSIGAANLLPRGKANPFE